MENEFSILDDIYDPKDEPSEFGALDQVYGEGVSDDVEIVMPKPIDKLADELGSQYYEGMDFKDAIAEFKRLEELPNTEKTLVGNLRYTDTVTGQVESVPPPAPAMFAATAGAIGQVLKAPFSDEVSLSDAYDTFTNPPAKVDGMRLLGLGVRESLGDAREMGAALMGNDEAVERIALNSPQIDTEDSIIDSVIADGGPALAAAVLGDKGLSKIGPAFSAITQYIPRFAKNLGRVLSAEVAATATVGTEDGNIVLGDDAILPISQGLNLGDSKSAQVVEQRVNTLVEAIGLTSLASGVIRTAADTAGLVYDMTLRPIMTVVGPEANREKAVFQDIANRLASITDATTEGERVQIIQSITDTIEANKEIMIGRLDANLEEMPVKLDTLSALIRGTDDIEMQAAARKVVAGMNTKAMPKFTTAVNAPTARLETEMQDYLDLVDASTPGEQTAAMQGAADDFAGQANDYLGAAQKPALELETEYNNALAKIGTGISEDLEFSGRLKELETVTGTDISRAKDGKLEDIMQGVRDGYEDLSNQKNTLYNSIEGGEIDPDALFTQLFDLNDDQISAAAAQAARSNPIKNMLDVINTKSVPDIDPETGKDIMRAPTDEERLGLFRDFMAEQGADFGYIYNTIRPELSSLASSLYSSGNEGAGKIVRGIVRYIDDDMVTFVENSDPALAEAARTAKSFYKDTFAPIFAGEGVMADYADLYNRTIGRTDGGDLMARVDGKELDRSGYDQGLEQITNTTMSSGMVAPAEQMMAALKIASDPNSMADYMVLDVLNKYAGDIRINGLDGASLTSMSQDLQQYASQLNKMFPEKAAQITEFVTQIENAAKSKGNLDNVIGKVEATVKAARDDIAQTELMGFLRTELGNDQYLATSNPQAAFSQLFNSKEGLAGIENLNLSINSLPPERAAIVSRGLEVAYMRQFKLKMSDFRRELGGSTPVKDVPMAKGQQEFDQILRVGREVFASKPEVAEALEAYAEVAGFVQANKNARTSIGLSPTAFLQEATTATNRLIFTLIGPLSRAGTRVRALSGAAFQKLDPEQKAMQIYDEILSNPDKFVELSRKYNSQPNNAANQDMLSRMLMSSGLKAVAATDYEDRPDLVNSAIGLAETYTTPAKEAIDAVTGTIDEQTEEAFK